MRTFLPFGIKKIAFAGLTLAASASLILAASGAFAAPAMTTTLSNTVVSAGAKVNLTTQVPAVSAIDHTTQEIVQVIDPTKVQLTAASDVTAPQGWAVSFSTDGTTFVSASDLTTPAMWASVVKVKATGAFDSLGTTPDGKQIVTNSVSVPGSVTTVNGAIRTNGDGFDLAFDSRGYLFNTYHHDSLSASIDCRKRSDGSFCSSSWPFALSSYGFHSNFTSTEYFDEVNKHLWLPVADRATGTGFLCIDVSTIETPAFCGGSKATAWHMVQARANAQETGIYQITSVNSKIYSWDILAPAILCFDYLANNGLGAACANAMPTFTHLVAGSANQATTPIPTTYTGFETAFGNLYGQLNGVETCFNASTYAKCAGWADYDIVLGSNNSAMAMYLQPNAAGAIIGVCNTNDAKCFAADGTRFTASSVIENALTNFNVARWRGSISTVGSKLLFNSIWDKPSYLYCYDYATSAACANWTASSSFGISGIGEMLMTPPGGSSWRVYTIKSDPLSSDCLWTNGDAPNPTIGQITISTATRGCTIQMPTATFASSQLLPKLTCASVSDLVYRKFSIAGLTKGVDYSSATISIFKADGTAVIAAGKTWDQVALDSSGSLDMSALTTADLGQGFTIKVNYAGRTNTNSSSGVLEVASPAAQLCTSVTALVICPTTTQIGTPQDQVFTFAATAATISSTGSRIDYSTTSPSLTVSAPAASACGFQLKAFVGQAPNAQGFPASPSPQSGVTATLVDSTGTVLTNGSGNPITAVSDATGNLTFGYVKAGTYKVQFADFALVNGVGAGDIAAVYSAPYTYTTGNIIQTSQNPVNFTTIQTPINSPAVSGTAGGADVIVKAAYIMRAVAVADVVSVKATVASTIDVLANDRPTTSASFNAGTLKICALGTTSSCALTTLTITGQGTYAVAAGKITFTPVSGFTGPVTTINYQVSDAFSNTPQTVVGSIANTVVLPPTAGADVLSGNTLTPISVDVTANDNPAAGTTIDKTSVKLCAIGTTTGCNQTSVYVTGKGTYSVNNLGVVSFVPDAGYVGAVPAITYSVNDMAGNPASATVTATVTATPPTLGAVTFAALGQGQPMTVVHQSAVAGSASIPATGAFTILSGSLPQGLSLNANTGDISGTPSVTGTFNFVVKVTDANGLTATKAQTLTVFAPPAITTDPANYAAYTGAQVSIANTTTIGSAPIMATGAFSATGLPIGVTINANTGVISGAASADGNYQIVVKVTDTNGLSATKTLTLLTTTKPVITTSASLPAVVAGVLATPIQQTKTQGTAPIAATGAWSIDNGSLPAGMTLDPNTGAISGTPTTGGRYSFTVKLVDTAGEIATKTETLQVNSGPTITTSPLTYKIYKSIATAISNTVSIGTGALQSVNGWIASGLPAGLSINGTTGVISGTPTVPGDYQVTVRATDVNSLFDEETLTISVATKPIITTASPLAPGVIGIAITPIAQTKTDGTAPIAATGAWTLDSGALPIGLAMNPNTGEITGTPTVTGTFTFAVKLVDTSGEFSIKTETITINSKPTITTTPLAYTFFTGNAASIANTVVAGTGAIPVSGAWIASGLPEGLSIDAASGQITGVPTAVGVSTVTVRVTDANGLFDEETLSITVTPPVYGPTLTTSPTTYKFGVNNPIGVGLDDFFASSFPIGHPRDIINTATQGTAPIAATGAWAATNLPPGLTIDANTGKITGTGTTVGTYQTEVKVTDSAGRFATKVLTINITQGPKNTTPRTYTYEVDIDKHVGILPVTIPQTYELGAAPLNSNGRPVPFLVSGTKPAPVAEVNIVSGDINVIPALAISPVTKKGYGTYTLKTVIVDANQAYDIATFTINIVKPGTNITSLSLPDAISGGTVITKTEFDLAGTSSKKLPVTYSVTTPKTCSIDPVSKKLQLLDAGKCEVVASSGTGALLSTDKKSFTITKLPQTVTIVAPGSVIPGTSTTAALATDDPSGFTLNASLDSGLAPVYTSLNPEVCDVDDAGTVTWNADLTVWPKVESDWHCQISVSNPGDFSHSAATPKTITLDATHVDPPPPPGGIATEPAQSAALPATGGTTPMKGGNSFKVVVDNKKKTVTVQPISKGRWIGPIYADITISYTPKGTTTEQVQTCARNSFGISVVDPKTKQIVTPPLGGDPLIVPEGSTYAKLVKAVIAPYRAMQGKNAVVKTVKGKKVTLPGYLDYKYFNGQASCVLDANAYAAFKSGVQMKAVAVVTRDRRWPTTYARYKSYDWQHNSNNGVIYPTVVNWVITIG